MMTDKKQIIIDGVDVSECRNFDIESYKRSAYDCDLNELHGYCICNNDCYFKQLARKTQECEELQVAYNKAQDILGRVNGANELKSYSLQESIKECDRYRKALEEIENLMQKVSDADECSYGDFDCCNCDSDNSCPTKVKRLILDIINKAKG